MSTKIMMKLSCLLVLVAVFLTAGQQNRVQSAPLDVIKDAAKTIAGNAAEAASKTEAVEEKGGVRASVLHTGANLVVDKALDAIGARYPVVAAGVPIVKQLSKPALNAIHSKINSIGEKRKAAATTTPAPEEAEKEAEKEAKTEVKNDDGAKQEVVKEEKAKETNDAVKVDDKKDVEAKEDAKVENDVDDKKKDCDDEDDQSKEDKSDEKKSKNKKTKKGKGAKKEKKDEGESEAKASDGEDKEQSEDKKEVEGEKKESEKAADKEVKKAE